MKLAPQFSEILEREVQPHELWDDVLAEVATKITQDRRAVRELTKRVQELEAHMEAPKDPTPCTCGYWDKQCQVHGDPFKTEITGGVEICECLCHVPIGSGQAYNTTSCIHCMVIG